LDFDIGSSAALLEANVKNKNKLEYLAVVNIKGMYSQPNKNQ
jgi:hypothetical protein